MVELRARKVESIADDIPLQAVAGPDTGDVVVLGWGGTYGACRTAAERCRSEGLSVAHVHLRYLNPLPKNLGEILRSYRTVLVPELNMGQLRMMIRAKYLLDARGLNKMMGKPFAVQEIVDKIKEIL
jgi:2-oxoglutarate ferredoxin oxidoreductase subunit alpha